MRTQFGAVGLRRQWSAMLVGTLLGLLATCSCLAQSSDEIKALKKQIEALQEGQKAIQKELEAIKALLLGRTSQSRQEEALSVAGAPFLGEKSAKLTLVEFFDYQCPFCARHYARTLPPLVAEYVKTGKLKYVVRDFPLESMHPLAFRAAEAAHCAGEQGKYWEMHQRLMDSQARLEPKNLSLHAQALGLDAQAFGVCLDSGKQAARIRRDIEEGEKVGVEGTPAFLLGFTDSSGSRIAVVRKLGGALPYSSFKEAIDGLLASSR